MSSLGLKSKSFLFSLSVHLLLAATAYAFIYACSRDTSHESASLVSLHLKAFEFSAPVCECMSENAKDDTTEVAKKQEIKKVSSVQKKKPVKKIKKEKQIPLKQIEVAQAELLAIQKEIVPEITRAEPVKSDEVEEMLEAEALVNKEKEFFLAQKESSQVTSAPSQESKVKVTGEKQYMQDNIALINALIKQNLYYPRIAKKRGMQGKVMVFFTLNTKGEVMDIKALGEIASILRKAAIKTVEKAAQSFPQPKEVLALQIPITYKLNQR